MLLSWTKIGWEDYTYWQVQDRKTIKRINKVITDIMRSPFDGIGDPEPLKHSLSGFWSRRISQEHRIVYEVRDELLIIHQCRFHYHK